MTLGERLKAARGEMTQGALARRSGVAQSMISMIETGERPTPGDAVLRALERGLGRPLGFLSATQEHDASLDRYFESDYARDRAFPPDEAARMRQQLEHINWKGPQEEAPPAAWDALVEAILRKEAAQRRRGT